MEVTIMPDNPRYSPRKHRELIQNLINDEKPRGNETRRNIDMIDNFSINDLGW